MFLTQLPEPLGLELWGCFPWTAAVLLEAETLSLKVIYIFFEYRGEIGSSYNGDHVMNSSFQAVLLTIHSRFVLGREGSWLPLFPLPSSHLERLATRWACTHGSMQLQ